MSKKKRKIVRPKYTAKSIRIQQAPKKPIPKELKFGIIFSVAALILAVILFFALYDDGSLPMQDGAPVMAGENWLIVNKGSSGDPKYYKVGEINTPDGYTADEPETQTNLRIYTFRPDDAGSLIDHYYATGINGKPVDVSETANSNYIAWGTGMEISEVKTAVVGGKEVYYFTTIAQPSDETETQHLLVAYLPAPRDSSILVSIAVPSSTDAADFDEAALLGILGEIEPTIVLEEK